MLIIDISQVTEWKPKQRDLIIKWKTFLIILLLGMLLCISINVASAAKIQTPNIEQGESIWFDIDVNVADIKSTGTEMMSI